MYPTKKLREVCEIKKWKKVNYSEQWKYNYIDIGILRTNIIEQYTNDEWIFCNKNDILIAWDGSKSGTVGFWLEWVIGSTLAKITIDTEMFLTEFIGKFLQGNFDYLNKNTSGAAIPHLWKDILINLEIPLPPLSTQKLIVEKLDMIFAEIEKSKNLLEKNLQNVDEMNKSVLEKVFANDKWERKKLGEVCENKKLDVWNVKTQNYLHKWKFPIIDQWKKFISWYSNDEGLVFQGNFPVLIYWDHTNIVKYIDFPFITWADGIKILYFSNKIDTKFIYYAILCLKPKNHWYRRHFPLLKQISIPLPPLETQKLIVEKLDNIFAENQKLKNLYQAQIKNLDEMKQSFLKKAFAGELV